jgi:hypothetical protein
MAAEVRAKSWRQEEPVHVRVVVAEPTPGQKAAWDWLWNRLLRRRPGKPETTGLQDRGSTGEAQEPGQQTEASSGG